MAALVCEALVPHGAASVSKLKSEMPSLRAPQQAQVSQPVCTTTCHEWAGFPWLVFYYRGPFTSLKLGWLKSEILKKPLSSVSLNDLPEL